MAGIRIGAGSLKGRRLAVPAGVRPTGARAREALFDVWNERIVGATVVDLFAGSGAVGVEALSRGAATVVLVEGDERVYSRLRKNLAAIGAGAAATAIRRRVPAGLAGVAQLRDAELLFADPPYDFGAYPALLEGLGEHTRGAAELVVEYRFSDDAPSGGDCWDLFSERRYGDSGLAFYRRK